MILEAGSTKENFIAREQRKIHAFMYLVTLFVYYIFTVPIFKPYSRLTKFLPTNLFNTILKLTGAYILSLKATESK